MFCADYAWAIKLKYSRTLENRRDCKAVRDKAAAPCKIEMSRNGGFLKPFTACVATKRLSPGILGEDLLKIDFDAIYDIAKRRNLEVTFIFSDRIERIPTEMQS